MRDKAGRRGKIWKTQHRNCEDAKRGQKRQEERVPGGTQDKKETVTRENPESLWVFVKVASCPKRIEELFFSCGADTSTQAQAHSGPTSFSSSASEPTPASAPSPASQDHRLDLCSSTRQGLSPGQAPPSGWTHKPRSPLTLQGPLPQACSLLGSREPNQ